MSKPAVRGKAAKVARFDALKPDWRAWQNCSEPGRERGVYRLVGTAQGAPLPGSDFSLSIMVCPPGNDTGPHDNAGDEIYMPLTGSWELSWEEDGEQKMQLARWDSAIVPAGVIRNLRNTGAEEAHLMAIVMGPAPSLK